MWQGEAARRYRAAPIANAPELAHAARGPVFWREAGITPKEVRQVLELYFGLIEREHGKHARPSILNESPETHSGAPPLRVFPDGP